jgi:hypothetical protein
LITEAEGQRAFPSLTPQKTFILPRFSSEVSPVPELDGQRCAYPVFAKPSESQSADAKEKEGVTELLLINWLKDLGRDGGNVRLITCFDLRFFRPWLNIAAFDVTHG